MEAFAFFFHTDGSGIGALFESKDDRKRKAKTSRNFCCGKCGEMTSLEAKIKQAHPEFWKETKDPELERKKKITKEKPKKEAKKKGNKK